MSVSHLYTIINHSVTSPSQLLANNLAKVVQGVGDFLLLLEPVHNLFNNRAMKARLVN